MFCWIASLFAVYFLKESKYSQPACVISSCCELVRVLGGCNSLLHTFAFRRVRVQEAWPEFVGPLKICPLLVPHTCHHKNTCQKRLWATGGCPKLNPASRVLLGPPMQISGPELQPPEDRVLFLLMPPQEEILNQGLMTVSWLCLLIVMSSIIVESFEKPFSLISQWPKLSFLAHLGQEGSELRMCPLELE